MLKIREESAFKYLTIEELSTISAEAICGNTRVGARKCLLTHPDIAVANLEYLLHTGSSEEIEAIKEALVNHPDANPDHLKNISENTDNPELAKRAVIALSVHPDIKDKHLEHISKYIKSEKTGMNLLTRPDIKPNHLKYLSLHPHSSVARKAVQALVAHPDTDIDHLRYVLKYGKDSRVVGVTQKNLIHHSYITSNDLEMISKDHRSSKAVAIKAEEALLADPDTRHHYFRYISECGKTPELKKQAHEARMLLLDGLVSLLYK